jgi:hypothetical protein
MRRIENSKETHEVFVGDIDYDISVASGARITIEGKWCLGAKGTRIGRAGTIPWPP